MASRVEDLNRAIYALQRLGCAAMTLTPEQRASVKCIYEGEDVLRCVIVHAHHFLLRHLIHAHRIPRGFYSLIKRMREQWIPGAFSAPHPKAPGYEAPNLHIQVFLQPGGS